MKKLGNIIFHLNLTIIISFNFITYCLSLIGFKFSVAYAVSFFILSILFVSLEGGIRAFRFNRLSLLFFFLLLVLINLLILQVDYGFTKFQLLISRMFLGLFILQLFLNLGYRINEKFIIGLGILISTVLLYQASLTNFILRTSMIIVESEMSRIIKGVIEDSRSLLFILIYTIVKFKKSPFYFFSISLFLAGILVTQTKQTLLVIILVIIPYVILNNKKNRDLRSLKRVGMTFILFIVGILIYNFDFVEDIYSAVPRLFELQENISNYNDRDYRGGMISWAFNLFLEKPFFGWGFGYTDQAYSYPHNIIVELLAELGIVGFSVFTVYFTHAYLTLRDKKLKLFVIAFSVLSLFSGNVMQNYFLFIALSFDYRFLETLKDKQSKLLLKKS
ncbi:O-antigen ligase family protein [Flavobacteriaceae bacterium]|nr:O-antigen ligase family protein [Flavobacteriaceae bacterium]